MTKHLNDGEDRALCGATTGEVVDSILETSCRACVDADEEAAEEAEHHG